MGSISGVGERLALIAGGALALALAQLLLAKRERNSRGDSNLETGRARSINTTRVRLLLYTSTAVVLAALLRRYG